MNYHSKKKVNHLLFGPDGNRRWAKENNVSFEEAYDIAAKRVSDVMTWCFEDNLVDELSLWLLQEYNLERSSEHVKPVIKAVMNCITYVAENPIIKEKGLQLRITGELDSFFSVYEGKRNELEKLLEKSEYNKGSVVNILVSYNGSKELDRATKKCIEGGVTPDLNNLSRNWSVSPVTLFFRTGQPDGFNRLSDYFPGIEQARLISTPIYPQNLSKDILYSVIKSFNEIKDSYDKL